MSSSTSSNSLEEKVRELEAENRRLRMELLEMQQKKLGHKKKGKGESPESSSDEDNHLGTVSSNDNTPNLEPSGASFTVYPVFTHDNKIHVVAAAKQVEESEGPLSSVKPCEINTGVESLGSSYASLGDSISNSSSVVRKKKKKHHTKKTVETRKLQKLARKQRKKILVVAQSDASVLLPEGEDSLRKLKLETRQKLLTRFKDDIKTIERPPHLEAFISKVISGHKELESFYLVDLGCVIRQKARWDKALPRIRPYYAVKSNPDARVIKTLSVMGAGFDCASKNEIIEVLSLGASPSDIIFANPCKAKSHILYAKEKGILRMTFDNSQEIDKIHELYPEAHLVLRLLPDDSHSSSPLGSKFGAAVSEWGPLMDKCIALKMKLIGVSFHVGSGNWDTTAHTAAINLARQAFDLGATKGLKFTLLDIGGGWPGNDDGQLNFDTIAMAIKPQIDHLFPPEIEVISEPGRYFCTEAYTLAVSIISKREKWLPGIEKLHEEESEDGTTITKVVQGAPQKQVLYYMAEGLYGSFNNIIFDHFTPSPLLLKQPSNVGSEASIQSHSSSSTPVSLSPVPVHAGSGTSLQPQKLATDPTLPRSPVSSPGPGHEEEHTVVESTLTHSKLFGPTCDSIDVIVPDIQLPDLSVGSWLYFVNMGAYTSASASHFNGFSLPNAFHFVAL